MTRAYAGLVSVPASRTHPRESEMRRFVEEHRVRVPIPYGVTIRRATPLDAELLARHRAAVWHEVGDWRIEELAPQIPVWTAFFAEHVAAGTYVGYVAEEGGSVLGSGAVLVYLAIPRPPRTSDRAGRLQSVYVVPAARRRGVARGIVEHLLRYAREAKLVSLALRPSEEARSLYASLGFEPADEMLLRFTGE